MVFCRHCGAQIIMTAYGEWRTDVPYLRLEGCVYFCTEACRESYAKRYGIGRYATRVGDYGP